MSWSLEEAIQRTGVLKEGHFLLSSGRHSRQYMQCAQLLQHPQESAPAGEELAKMFSDLDVDLVVGPALGGVIIAHEVARSLNVRCIFAERKEGEMQIRRGFQVSKGEKVLVIEDVVTTGGSVLEVIRELEALGADIVAVGSLVDRTSGDHPFQVPYRALKAIDIKSYSADNCPLCKEGMPTIKPGSRNRK